MRKRAFSPARFEPARFWRRNSQIFCANPHSQYLLGKHNKRIMYFFQPSSTKGNFKLQKAPQKTTPFPCTK